MGNKFKPCRLPAVAVPSGNPNRALVQGLGALLSLALAGESSAQWSAGKQRYHKVQHTPGDQPPASVDVSRVKVFWKGDFSAHPKRQQLITEQH